MNKNQKKIIVDQYTQELSDVIKNRGAVGSISYNNVIANDLNKIRRLGKTCGVKILNIPNKVFNIILSNIKLEISDKFKGNQNLILIAKDSYELAEFLNQIKKSKTLDLRKGEVSMRYLVDKSGILDEKCGFLGNQEVIMSQLCNGFLSPAKALSFGVKYLSERE